MNSKKRIIFHAFNVGCFFLNIQLQELHSEDDIKQSNGSSPLPTDAETRSPSPISISSSETSSIMQKLKKMRSRMDEK